MKKTLLTVLSMFALGTAASLAGGIVVPNTSVQIFKGTIKSKFEKLEASLSQKGSDSTLVYYIQSRAEATEQVVVINSAAKSFTVLGSKPAAFSLANTNKSLFNLRSDDLFGGTAGGGSLVGNTTSATFGDSTIEFFTPKLTYQYENFTTAPGALYLATHDKATLKADKKLLKIAYAEGATTVSEALAVVLDYLVSKGFVGIA
ncbi:hypothetical protein [Luteolibacter sp. Populi]|uniref:hypothetical protein n=1 Tax=Luteolibacter sp. Populi TaxID=3230487 RepID=UPI003466D397